MHWTTVVPLALSALHAAIAHDEASVVNAARIAALALVMETASNCDAHGLSILLAAPTIAALTVGVGFEILHAVNLGATEQRRAEDLERWRGVQRVALRRDAYQLLRARLGLGSESGVERDGLGEPA